MFASSRSYEEMEFWVCDAFERLSGFRFEHNGESGFDVIDSVIETALQMIQFGASHDGALKQCFGSDVDLNRLSSVTNQAGLDLEHEYMNCRRHSATRLLR